MLHRSSRRPWSSFWCVFTDAYLLLPRNWAFVRCSQKPRATESAKRSVGGKRCMRRPLTSAPAIARCLRRPGTSAQGRSRSCGCGASRCLTRGRKEALVRDTRDVHQPRIASTVANGEVRGFHVSVDIAAEPRRGACHRDAVINGARGQRTRNAPARVHSLQRVQHLHANLHRNTPAA